MKEKSARTMLDILRREAKEASEQLLADICVLCHWPFVETEASLPERCSECDIAADLETLLSRTRTVAMGEVMAIVAEEMSPERGADGNNDG